VRLRGADLVGAGNLQTDRDEQRDSMKKKWAFVAVAAAFSISLAACGSKNDSASGGGSGSDKGPLKVGLMIPIADNPTDPKIFVNPAQMAVDEINAKGGVDGHKLELTQYDSGFTAEGALTAMQKAISEKVSLVVGLPIADQVLAVRPLLDRAKIPLLFLGGGFAAGYDPDNKTGSSEWAFRVGTPSEDTVNAGVQYAIDKLGAKDVGLLLRDDAGKGTSTNAAKAGAETAGGTIAATQTIPLNSTDLTTQILAMKSTDAIFTTDFVPGITAALKEIDQQGLKVPLITGQTGMTVYLGGTGGDLVKNMYSSAPCNMFDPYSDAAKTWVTTFKSKYSFMPDPNSSTTYDAFYLYKNAYEKAGGSGAELLKALESEDYEGVCMHYKVDDQHFMGTSEVVIDFSGEAPKTVATYDFADQKTQ
jgi:branched-chain amino acid transport system substrate-binding protein